MKKSPKEFLKEIYEDKDRREVMNKLINGEEISKGKEHILTGILRIPIPGIIAFNQEVKHADRMEIIYDEVRRVRESNMSKKDRIKLAKNKKEAGKKDDDNFIEMLKWIGIAVLILASIFLFFRFVIN